jgi:hypothetical protein
VYVFVRKPEMILMANVVVDVKGMRRRRRRRRRKNVELWTTDAISASSSSPSYDESAT